MCGAGDNSLNGYEYRNVHQKNKIKHLYQASTVNRIEEQVRKDG